MGLFYYNKLHLNSMKGIHIQFQGIIQFIDSTLANITSQAADCYLLNLQKITLETFTILHIALTNAPNQIPEQVLTAFQKTTAKFKEYFKRKPKLDTDKQELYREDFDEVQHFLDNRPLLRLNNESERGELFKFLSENQEKQKNNKILLDNRPKYAYGASKINLDELKKPITPNAKPILKQRSQQTYSTDFVIKPECIFPALQKESQSDEQTQTYLSIEAIKELIEQYTREIIEEKDENQMKKNVGDLLVCLQTSATKVLKGAMRKRFGEGEGDRELYNQKYTFIEELIQGKENLQESDLSLLGFHHQKKESKKKQKNAKKPAKRGSEIVKATEGPIKNAARQSKDLAKKKDETSTSKNIPASGKSFKSIQMNGKTQNHYNDRRTSISNFALGTAKLEKSKVSKPSQVVGNGENQTYYPSIQEPSAVAKKSGGIAALKNKGIDQSCEYNQDNNLNQQEINAERLKEVQENKDITGKPEQNKDNRTVKAKDKEMQQGAQEENEECNPFIENKSQQKGPSNDSSTIIKKKAKYQQDKNEEIMNTSDLLRFSEEKQLQQPPNWQGTRCVIKTSNHPLDTQEKYTQQKSTINLLPVIDKLGNHSSLPHKDKNTKSNSQLFDYQNSRDLFNSRFKQTHLSQNSLHLNQNQIIETDNFAPKSMNSSLYNHQYTTSKYKLPVVKREPKVLPEIRSQQVNQAQHKAWVQREGEHLLREIKQNTSTQRQKSIEWFKLVKNIKQYQKHHLNSCGANCVHLSKFYDFLKKQNLSMYVNRKQLSLHKKNIEINMSLE